jgi:aspartyl protease family protein
MKSPTGRSIATKKDKRSSIVCRKGASPSPPDQIKEHNDMTRYTIAFLIMALGLGLLIINHDGGETFGMNNDDFAQIVYLAPIAALLSVGILAGRRTGFSTALKQIAAWLFIILLLVAGYTYRSDVEAIGNRVLSSLIPGRATSVTLADGTHEVLLTRSMGGHFASDVSVNGQSLHMLVDTGASSVVLSHQDAERAGIDVASLNYNVTVRTANGTTTAAAVRLAEVRLGSITRQNISALVSRDGALDGSLLGMSFLSTLSSMQMQTDQLRLRD